MSETEDKVISKHIVNSTLVHTWQDEETKLYIAEFPRMLTGGCTEQEAIRSLQGAVVQQAKMLAGEVTAEEVCAELCPEPAGAPAQQGVTLEELKALAEDGLLVTFDKDHRFSFSRVVNLMAEFAEHMLLGRGTREKNTSLRDQLAIIDAIANAIEGDK